MGNEIYATTLPWHWDDLPTSYFVLYIALSIIVYLTLTYVLWLAASNQLFVCTHFAQNALFMMDVVEA